jgi:hypothetical protein
MATLGPKYEVTAVLTSSTSVQEFSKVFEGLSGLQRSRKIRLRIVPSSAQSVPRVLRLEVSNRDGARRTVAIDIADDVEVLDPGLLGTADVYFKRSLSPALAPSKVQPFGLNNPAIRPSTALAMVGARLRTGRNLRELAADARQLFALPSPRAFEHSPEEAVEPLVLFQTRLWEPSAADPEPRAINDERATLIRALRSSFGARFLGGAIPTPFVRTNYPDVATSLPFSMRAYPALLKRPLVAVYSRGLLDSLAFKMSEYLAASRCIVGHAPSSVLPQPLVPGHNYLPFETPDQCVVRCEELLSRPAMAAEMRRSNWDYYQAQVEPRAHLLSVLDQAFAD